MGGFEDCVGYDGWKAMVTRSRKDVCFPGASTQNPPLSPRPTPPPGSQLTRFPCLLKRQKGHRLLSCCRNCKLQQQTSKGLEQHGFAEEGQTNIHRLVISVTSTQGTSCDGSHTPSEMIVGLTKMLCMARLFST